MQVASENGEKVRLQNLRDFTVQIRDSEMEEVVGTGIAVSIDGLVVTCAHVVEAALGRQLRDAGNVEVCVYFPQAPSEDAKPQRATVAAYFPQHDDDVVLLRLASGIAPLTPEQIAVLGRAEDSCYHPFRSYGFRRLEAYIAGHAHGTILDCVPAPEGRDVQAEPVQLQSQQINEGMSGAAVLDVERNLVIGIVSEAWFSDQSIKDRDTAWAVNARVLSIDPFNLPMRDEPLEKRVASQPRSNIEAVQAVVTPDLGIAWNDAPAPLPEWVGRKDLLEAISCDWVHPKRHVTSLIGFGGEGKSILARQWVEHLCRGDIYDAPVSDGVFWWGFYSRPGVDEFFGAALTWIRGGHIDPRKIPSSNVRAQVIAAMLGAGHYLFVLDGLEAIQHQGGDKYGLLVSTAMREFLSYFAAPGHKSFCLVTSRVPLLDLMDYTTYTHRDVTPFSPAEGRALLRAVGVGQNATLSHDRLDESLDRIIADWNGHALTLSLIGAYLSDWHGGNVAKVKEIPSPTSDEPRYERVHRVLRRYDDHLTDAERAFLALFSAFRTPVGETAFHWVFRAKPAIVDRLRRRAINAPIAAMDDTTFAAMVGRLLSYRILHYTPRTHTYTTHPLVRAHYYAHLMAGTRAQEAHKRIKDYYLDLAEDTPPQPTLDLKQV